MNNLLKIENLTVELKRDKQINRIINNISFDLKENSCLGIVGESGSGKSMTCKAIMGLLDQSFHVQGEAHFNGRSLLSMNKEDLRRVRGKEIGMILQNPMTAFNPLYTIGNQIIETLREHVSISKKEALTIAINTLEKMKLKNPQNLLEKYPHQLSGGMLQRVMIGIAIALKPKLIIADEPTTALDSITQFEVINELINVRKHFNTSIIIISHDLGVISKLADHVLVLNGGQMVEYGELKNIFTNPQHEHTKYLIHTKIAMMKRYHQVLNRGYIEESKINATGS
ncbi:nickel import ATP-binding protein NikD [Anaerobacillus alkalidiazotrophicus]|uniref:Nickel import ATP-binding protein NikD n=1 Tax=Anaerobacillus alkalidiazotrophicus TaxID=472963 RepID=A0A1S2M7I8_9BACI|nr:ABC transporter ATP-binding protein [Anaerobacillus alkalidiazotrophicus]OIJ18186.1 nickel import ATP-binding protein NikD [Anaerobacillus alkalidiazotrophicus]OIJ19665.1 nickel import ATP-binding protein NikD [Anaerobacillus alkalidiazotrophicus]